MAFESTDKVKTRKVLLTLDEETITAFKVLGEGNVSLGARRAAKGVEDRPTGKAPKRTAAPHIQTMRALGITYENGRWRGHDGVSYGISKVKQLYIDHPELRAYADAV